VLALLLGLEGGLLALLALLLLLTLLALLAADLLLPRDSEREPALEPARESAREPAREPRELAREAGFSPSSSAAAAALQFRSFAPKPLVFDSTVATCTPLHCDSASEWLSPEVMSTCRTVSRIKLPSVCAIGCSGSDRSLHSTTTARMNSL